MNYSDFMITIKTLPGLTQVVKYSNTVLVYFGSDQKNRVTH